jgi:hypothetical protein
MAAEWTDREKRLYDALKLTVDYIGDGAPDDTYTYVMTQARAAMKDFVVVPPRGVDEVLELLKSDPRRSLYKGQDFRWYITYSGGEVPLEVVQALVATKAVNSVYSDCPNDSFHVGPTLDCEATRAVRQQPGNRHEKVYL